jgi:predicted GNAT family N-acyltransferase
MKPHIVIADWYSQKSAAQQVRSEVFIVEQNIPLELEWDDMDAVSVHAVAFDADGAALGTGRLLPDGHVGRMAVRKAARRTGVGSALLQALMLHARQRGDRSVQLNAQISAEAFYAHHGFVPQGDVFMEAGIPHVHMRHAFD